MGEIIWRGPVVVSGGHENLYEVESVGLIGGKHQDVIVYKVVGRDRRETDDTEGYMVLCAMACDLIPPKPRTQDEKAPIPFSFTTTVSGSGVVRLKRGQTASDAVQALIEGLVQAPVLDLGQDGLQASINQKTRTTTIAGPLRMAADLEKLTGKG